MKSSLSVVWCQHYSQRNLQSFERSCSANLPVNRWKRNLLSKLIWNWFPSLLSTTCFLISTFYLMFWYSGKIFLKMQNLPFSPDVLFSLNERWTKILCKVCGSRRQVWTSLEGLWEPSNLSRSTQSYQFTGSRHPSLKPTWSGCGDRTFDVIFLMDIIKIIRMT